MWILSLGATVLLIMAWPGSNVLAETPSTVPLKRVLVLYSDERLLPANIIMDQAIRATFAADSSDRIEFYSEFLDITRFPGEAQQQRQRDFLRDKYSGAAARFGDCGQCRRFDFRGKRPGRIVRRSADRLLFRRR